MRKKPDNPSQLNMYAYFNSSETPNAAEVKKGTLRSWSQNRAILDIFKKHPQKKFTPIEIFMLLNKGAKKHDIILLTSVRRAITTLTEMNALIKNKHIKKKEMYGDTNWTWEYNPAYVEETPKEKPPRKKKDKDANTENESI